MTKEITGRQAIILMAIVMCATKFFILPSNLVSVANQNVLYLLALFFVIEFLVLMILVQLSLMYPDKTFYQILSDALGRIVAKLIYSFFLVFFVCKLIINIIETYTFFLGTMYDNLSPVLYLLPILFLVFYMVYIGLRPIGRTAELIWIFVFFGLSVVLFISIPNADFRYMLPWDFSNMASAHTAMQNNIMWFGDYFVYLFFFGKIKFNKHYFKSMAVVSGLVLCVITLFLVVFFCIFPYVAGMIHYGVSDITHITMHITNIGQLDWINVSMWTFASLIQTVIFAYCAVDCLRNIFSIKSKVVAILILFSVLIAMLWILDFNIIMLIQFVQSPIKHIFAVLFAIIILTIFVHFVFKKKINAKKVAEVLNE